jgi:hypothetical protein
MLPCIHPVYSVQRLTRRFLLASGLAAAMALGLGGCGGGGGTADNGSSGANVNLSGRITYDAVPAIASGMLDYAHTESKAARGVQVEAVADDGTVLATASADVNGSYALQLPVNTNVRIRAKARLLQSSASGSNWDFAVRDNTSDGYRISGDSAALYAIEGAQFNSGTTAQARDLHAGSGWNGSGYTAGARAAAPFAILDQIYAAKQKVLAADSGAVFAPMIAYWSPANRPSTANDSTVGAIVTTHWSAGGNRPGLYILGAENVDTDEYDSAVIVHEWGHYFESRFSRADNPGGNHGAEEMLDMRLAFGEAWGNALAGMVRDDPLYVDTMWLQQSAPRVVFDLNLIPANEPKTWSNEASVQYVLYQLYKSPEIGFGQIYQVMVNQEKNTEALTSLFSFATYLRNQASLAGKNVLDGYLAGINTVNNTNLDIWGSKQTWTDVTTQNFVKPVYTSLKSGNSVQVCRTDAFGSTGNNKLGNIRYLRLGIIQAGNYKLKITSDTATTSLRAQVYSRGGQVPMQGIDPNTVQLALTNGDYVVTITDASAPRACFTAALSQ